MRRSVLYSLALLIALNAFGHAGEVHTYLGTVTMVHADGSFMLEKTDGKTIHIAVSTSTVYIHADGQPATKAELVPGTRVSVTMALDGKTATKIKLPAAKK